MTALLTTLMLIFYLTPFAALSVSQSQNEERRPVAASDKSDKTDDNVIKLSARLVNLNISVIDRSGKKVSKLQREDFLVLEDNVEQEVAYFEQVNAPINLVLLLDLSGSIASKLSPMKKAAKRFIDSLNDGDSVAVGTFTSRFNLVSGFTTNRKLLKDRVNDIEHTDGDTAFYDAAWETYDLLDQVKIGRKAVVVLTDGVDSSFRPDEQGSKRTFDELAMRAVEEDATVYPIYLDTEAETGGHYSAEAFSVARKQLQALADQTGGAYFRASRVEDLDGVYQQVSAELHALYSLAYAAKDTRKDVRWRRIKVEVKREGVLAKTKRGYYAK